MLDFATPNPDFVWMDPLTHGVAGATLAAIVADPKKVRPAATAGFASALIADLDYFIRSASDPLLTIEIHRQFTHSLLFIPAGALVASLLLWLPLRRYLKPQELYLFALAGYATAGLLDSFTSYGTVLLWPFSDTRFAWNLISVLDPLFTVPLILLTARAVISRNRRWAALSLCWMVLYLSAGMVQKERAASAQIALAESRSHQPERVVVKPTIGNLILWRSVYEFQDTFYVDAIRPSLFSTKIYEGERVQRLYPEEWYEEYMAAMAYFDLMRFSRLSDGFIIHHPDHPSVVGDVRYSMLPNSATPLWGVELDMSDPDRRAEFLYFRDAAPEVRSAYFRMVFGKDL